MGLQQLTQVFELVLQLLAQILGFFRRAIRIVFLQFGRRFFNLRIVRLGFTTTHRVLIDDSLIHQLAHALSCRLQTRTAHHADGWQRGTNGARLLTHTHGPNADARESLSPAPSSWFLAVSFWPSASSCAALTSFFSLIALFWS